jgi:F420-0:gamma-glutamyl ligase
MADEQKPKGRKKRVEPETENNVLVTTAKAIGSAAGKIASLAGVEPAPARSHAKSAKRPKLQKKNRPRLPRRQKKAQQKGVATQGEV